MINEVTNINLYSILGVSNISGITEIKSSYRKLSLIYHPDKNKDDNANQVFSNINLAYKILSNEEHRKEYDLKSRFGSNYSAAEEFYDFNFDFDFKNDLKRREDFKEREVLHVIIEVDENFSGKIEYPRWVTCKTCSGSGQDLKGKIVVRDEKGEIKGTFESEEGCDFCEGTGRDWRGNQCQFCNGGGKIGLKSCEKCKGERRILGKQKLNKIELMGEETKIEGMGHVSPTERGKCGHLILRQLRTKD